MNNILLNFTLLFMTASATPQTVCFSIPAGTVYCATLLEYQQDKDQIWATIEVTPETWEIIDLVMLFNLHWNKRNAGSISGEKAVQIRMVLDKNIYDTLHAQGDLLIDTSSFLAADPSHPMRSAMHWFGIEVTEEVELPEALKDKGTLREGFTTQWKDDFQ